MVEPEPAVAALSADYDSAELDVSRTSSNTAETNPSPPITTFKAVGNRVGTPLGLFIGPASKTSDKTMATLTLAQDQESLPVLSSHDLPLSPHPSDTNAVDHFDDERYSKPTANPNDISSALPPTPPNRLDEMMLSSSSLDKVHPVQDSVSSLDGSADADSPLRTGSVQPDTAIAHPKPKPIVRTTPNTNAGKTPLSGPPPRRAPAENIAQLEATAERLSMTSSIDNAIRDLHGELKRSDSRRSSILAASVRAASIDESFENAPSATEHLKRHLSTSSSIVSTNTAARHGGYSPAGFVMLPGDPISSRLRPGSANSTSRPELETEIISSMSRHGPGKASVRSVRSTKLSLADIAESEPVSLNSRAFEEADAAPPIEWQDDQPLAQAPAQRDIDIPNTDAFHKMLGDSFSPAPAMARPLAEEPVGPAIQPQTDIPKPSSLHSKDTIEEGQDAFVDFDGVHWEPSAEDMQPPPEFDLEPFDLQPLDLESETKTQDPEMPRSQMPAPVNRARPTSYFDPESGQTMLYYPARVPAMLNLPPKLSDRPKAFERNKRRSQVMSVMMNINEQSTVPKADRRKSGMPERPRDSWLPDPIAGHRGSFHALSSHEHFQQHLEAEPEAEDENAVQPALEPDSASDGLRRPQRLSRMGLEKNQPYVSQQDYVSPHLRASAFFDVPSSTLPNIEIKDGSAMATLDGILDASANAPVNAFTDHSFAGKLGSEVYGKEKKKKHKPQQSTVSLGVVSATSAPAPKKRSSFMWLGKRSSSYNHDEKAEPESTAGSPNLGVHADGLEHERPASSIDGDERRSPGEGEEGEQSEEEEGEIDGYQGPPTTLLAELQLRKEQQKQRTRNLSGHPEGMYATLLEMDTVAEAQRKDRQSKRVNLAWEDPDAHLDQNGSDDEDVPLAIIAAMHQGAKNKADLDRPIGLMEKRHMEDNEPLSQRRARLQGRVSVPDLVHNRQSMISILGQKRLGATSPAARPDMTPSPQPVEEIEEETLAQRRKRLAGQGDDGELPEARPVSRAFSAELLSQFGDLETTDDKPTDAQNSGGPVKQGEEETLGQRRRRLQAEREAREQEMSYGNANNGQPRPRMSRQLSMADVLTAHPKKDPDVRRQQERQRAEEEHRVARERDAKMAALRQQMPTQLIGPNVSRSGGFQSGMYNDGSGGRYGQTSYGQAPAPVLNHRASQMLNGYPVAMQQQQQQQAYGVPGMYGGMNNMSGYNTMSGMNVYGANGIPQQGVPMNGGPIDRVEQWRRSVMH